jgi:hypothetical protein
MKLRRRKMPIIFGVRFGSGVGLGGMGAGRFLLNTIHISHLSFSSVIGVHPLH